MGPVGGEHLWVRALDEGDGPGVRDVVLAAVEDVGLAALELEGPRGLVVLVGSSESKNGCFALRSDTWWNPGGLGTGNWVELTFDRASVSLTCAR